MAFRMTKVHGTHHHVPVEVIPIIEGLEKIVGTEKINYRNFVAKGSSKKGVEVRYYDEQKQVLTIRVNHPEYIQVFHIKVTIPQIKSIYDFVQAYKF